MSYDKDELFNMLYNDEFSKIPYPFRFGKLRVKIVMSMLVAFCVSSCILPVVLLAMHLPGSLKTLIAMASLTALVALWLIVSLGFEKRAFKKASSLSFRYQVYAQDKAAQRLSKWRIHSLEC